ncbi:MAG TPA: hypothetical protein DEO84_02460 [candidate division Zixibacteria bacterium]|nr:hypothetical protein [candidate division Zixibacteria bacterium]HBZ00160.1 hypothetical protein [candidate division Zixibacteria bacterium]
MTRLGGKGLTCANKSAVWLGLAKQGLQAEFPGVSLSSTTIPMKRSYNSFLELSFSIGLIGQFDRSITSLAR